MQPRNTICRVLRLSSAHYSVHLHSQTLHSDYMRPRAISVGLTTHVLRRRGRSYWICTRPHTEPPYSACARRTSSHSSSCTIIGVRSSARVWLNIRSSRIHSLGMLRPRDARAVGTPYRMLSGASLNMRCCMSLSVVRRAILCYWDWRSGHLRRRAGRRGARNRIV